MLAAAGLQPGQRLAAWVDNPAAELCLWLAAMRQGARPARRARGILAQAGHAVDMAVVLRGEGGGSGAVGRVRPGLVARCGGGGRAVVAGAGG